MLNVAHKWVIFSRSSPEILHLTTVYLLKRTIVYFLKRASPSRSHIRNATPTRGLGRHVRRPCGLLNTALARRQAESHTTVDRHRTENTVLTALGRIQHNGAVGRDTRAFIKARFSEHRQPVGHQIKHSDVVPAISLMHQRDVATILCNPRASIVGPLKSDPFYFLGTQVVTINLRSSTPVGRKRNDLPSGIQVGSVSIA